VIIKTYIKIKKRLNEEGWVDPGESLGAILFGQAAAFYSIDRTYKIEIYPRQKTVFYTELSTGNMKRYHASLKDFLNYGSEFAVLEALM